MACLSYGIKAFVVDRAEKARERMLKNELKEMEEAKTFYKRK